MKKILFAVLAMVLGIQSMSAQDDFYAPGKRVGFSVGIGAMDGITLEGAVSLSKWCSGRVGVDIMPGVSYSDNSSYKIDNQLSTEANIYLASRGIFLPEYANLSLKGSVGRTQVHVLFDAYPFPNKSNFFVTAGFYFSGRKFIKADGRTDKELIQAKQALMESPEFMSEAEKLGVNIADYDVPFDDNGNINAGIGVGGFRPYVGLGFGRAIPKKRVSCRFEMGVQFHGTPKIVDSNNNNLLDVHAGALEDKKDDVKKIMEVFTVLPVIKFSIRGRIL